MDLKQISKWVVITGAIIIFSIKLVIRPLRLFDDPLRFLLGIAPNLIGSFLIPFGAWWFFSGQNYLLARIFHIRSNYDLRVVCILGFIMLVFNEYLQLIPVFGRTFDYYDIIFSGVGLITSYFVFARIRQQAMAEAI